MSIKAIEFSAVLVAAAASGCAATEQLNVDLQYRQVGRRSGRCPRETGDVSAGRASGFGAAHRKSRRVGHGAAGGAACACCRQYCRLGAAADRWLQYRIGFREARRGRTGAGANGLLSSLPCERDYSDSSIRASSSRSGSASFGPRLTQFHGCSASPGAQTHSRPSVTGSV